jgi:hypothetical protein
MRLSHLKQAEQHVAEGERHIAEQEARVAELLKRGHKTATAQQLLHNFYALQAEHIQHRDRLLKELAQDLAD